LCRSLLPKGCRANQAQLKIPDGCCQETVNYSYQLLEMLKKSLYLARSERAGNRVRTDDLLITNQLLYQLSYAGFSGGCKRSIFWPSRPIYAAKTPRPKYASEFLEWRSLTIQARELRPNET
jgi:hypothetical protein